MGEVEHRESSRVALANESQYNSAFLLELYLYYFGHPSAASAIGVLLASRYRKYVLLLYPVLLISQQDGRRHSPFSPI